ncbi:hypothetical protein KBJ98_01990 [Flavobacterium sp. F-328]|uniref:Uncharacterized protein n=1 Tax=Flavobacterium erciyesense TaxID=2825842 RepID=A0ABS5D0D1_9FLAO|nr:hypothetical protein [Flavobacterium erciyesense]MBQ0907466.1 hypothetical protein [Flavobacterium erciyesense]
MSLIKIIANNYELEIVRETLTITKENNSFSNDFKVSRSDFPFLIVENSKTKKAIGSRDITSFNKPKVVPVVVEELNERYYGQLQIISYLPGFRKVTLRYATQLLEITEKPIAAFMPSISVIPNENNPVPYTQESELLLEGASSFNQFAKNQITKSYPEVKFNFPKMYWRNKFGTELKADDEWFGYLGFVNFFDDDLNFVSNTYTIASEVVTTSNGNVPSPQLYLLSPLFYALQSLGWRMVGDFVESEFIQKIILLSSKDNLCKTNVYAAPTQLNFSNPLVWEAIQVAYAGRGPQYTTYRTKIQFTLTQDKSFILNWKFKITDATTDLPGQIKTYARLDITGSGGGTRGGGNATTYDRYGDRILLFSNTMNGNNLVFQGTHEFKGVAGDVVTITFGNLHKTPPVEYSLSLYNNDGKKVFYQFHPTIDLGRFCPDWTFGTYLNELKKLFNLKITIDDTTKKLALNFNEAIIQSSEKVVLKKSFLIKSHEHTQFDAFHLKFENDEDKSVWVTRAGSQLFSKQESSFVNTIESKFKFVPRNGLSSVLSDDLESKSGVGLMIYDSDFAPHTSESFNEQKLQIEGDKGICNTFWKNFLKFRLNAEPIEIVGYFTEIELSKIQKTERIYIDHQDFFVSVLEYSETEKNNFEVLMKLESVNF